MVSSSPMNSKPLNRRGFLKMIAAGSLAAGLGAAGFRHWLEAGPAARLQETRLLMGTVVNLTVISEDPEAGAAAIRATFSEMERLIEIFDHRRRTSALGVLNRQGSLQDAPGELVEVVTKGLEMGELTAGAFDITVKPVLDAYSAGKGAPASLRDLVDYRQVSISGSRIALGRAGMEITLDSLAKGRVVDGGAAVLRRMGFENILVEAGGDLATGGVPTLPSAPGDRSPWEVGILSPREAVRSGTIARVSLAGQALATSGDYQNSFTDDFSLHHILDPRTLKSPEELASATAIAPTAMEADAWSTALMVLGSRAGLALVESQPQIEALLLGKDLKQVHSPGFPISA